MRADKAYTGHADIDRLLFSWGRVIADARGWTRGFALSIQRDRKKPGWTPSQKQLAVMQRLVAELPQALPDEVELIERE